MVAGQRDVAGMAAAACLLSSGHLLIEDIPGVGKTLLAQVVAAAVGGTFHRIQGTPDLLPGDVTGSMVPDHETFRLRFRPGPMFANVVVFDELNRTNPRTQSALLEAAEEATVTIDGTTHSLPDPFMLVATQNPIELAGTYRLGEGASTGSQLSSHPVAPGSTTRSTCSPGDAGASCSTTSPRSLRSTPLSCVATGRPGARPEPVLGMSSSCSRRPGSISGSASGRRHEVASR